MIPFPPSPEQGAEDLTKDEFFLVVLIAPVEANKQEQSISLPFSKFSNHHHHHPPSLLIQPSSYSHIIIIIIMANPTCIIFFLLLLPLLLLASPPRSVASSTPGSPATTGYLP
jgi:hypothetical protein